MAEEMDIEVDRRPIPLEDDDKDIEVDLSLKDDFKCFICQDVVKEPMAVMECLHRFCKECMERSLRQIKRACPACRGKLASRRELIPDPLIKGLISVLFPNIDEMEEDELKQIKEFNKSLASDMERREKTRNEVSEVVFVIEKDPNEVALEDLSSRYYRSSSAMSVLSLKKHTIHKFGGTNPNILDLFVLHDKKTIILDDRLTLEDIVQNFWTDPRRDLVLYYRLHRQALSKKSVPHTSN